MGDKIKEKRDFMPDIATRLAEKGITLPESVPALFNYVPFVVTGSLVFIAGQVPLHGSRDYKGQVGVDLTLEEGREAAKQCGINILAQIRDAVAGDWARVKKCVKLGGFVNCTTGFEEQSQVINAASDLMVEVLGEEIGRHARFAVGAPSLPANFAVEIEAIFEINV
jgi:enamine deaminase RidA (YjgF/YER057c/UK114 family)